MAHRTNRTVHRPSVFESLAEYGEEGERDEHLQATRLRQGCGTANPTQNSMIGRPEAFHKAAATLQLPFEVWALVLTVSHTEPSPGFRTFAGLNPEDVWPLRRVSRSWKFLAERSFFQIFNRPSDESVNLRNLPKTLERLVGTGHLRNAASFAWVLVRAVIFAPYSSSIDNDGVVACFVDCILVASRQVSARLEKSASGDAKAFCGEVLKGVSQLLLCGEGQRRPNSVYVGDFIGRILIGITSRAGEDYDTLVHATRSDCLASGGSRRIQSYPDLFRRLALHLSRFDESNPISQDVLLQSCDRLLSLSPARQISLRVVVRGAPGDPSHLAHTINTMCSTKSDDDFRVATEIITGVYRGTEVNELVSALLMILDTNEEAESVVGGLLGALFPIRPTMTGHVLARVALKSGHPRNCVGGLVVQMRLPRQLLPQLFHVLGAISNPAFTTHLPATIEELRLSLTDTLSILRNWPSAIRNVGRDLVSPRLNSGAWTIEDTAEVLRVLSTNNREQDAAWCVVEAEMAGSLSRPMRAALHGAYRRRAEDALGSKVLAHDTLQALEFHEELLRASMGLAEGKVRGDGVLRRIMLGGSKGESRFRWKDGGRARRDDVGVFERQ
ncbi:hypothetical protein M427DRAFT_44957 [Gonapodya prolifera JEL478]|uniref:Uncharacterized protein n=1 Tax=Gonapodya prolifera (strain JEL478) TaxID=1344416 RepID=A0A139ADN5_GONPJ|nr:hypothetical protein M427DRAFT_44957 [Gonapodya prolifera JEL478]|eukprot:KXS14533.1 hypothetical protein M427DRAFT_44957 [Gonapodya prolifera JEL478]